MNKKVLRRLIDYIGKQKYLLLGAVISAIVSVVASLMGPIFIGKAIDNMIGKSMVNFQKIFNVLIILVLIYGCGALFSWFLTYLTNKISYKAVNSMRHDLFNKINMLPLKFYDNNAHGDIISRFINDIDLVADGMLQGLGAILTGVVTIVGSIGFMISINRIMALVVVLAAPLTFVVAKFITTRSHEMFAKQAKELGALNGYAEEIIAGQKTVKAFNYQEPSFEKFKDINEQLYKAGVKSQFYGSLTNPSTRLVNNIIYSIVGVIGSFIAIKGTITIGDISSFLIYSNLFSKPFNEITGVFTQIQGALASAKRIFNILDFQEEDTDNLGKTTINRCKGKIDIKNLSFAYDKEKPLIKNLNLEVKEGSKIAIVGKTGAGKTTLVNLLMRFYEGDSGSITIDDVDIRELPRDVLRKNFGMVLQDTVLFEDTIKNNIAYGKDHATEEEIVSAAKKANAHSFIMKLPKGYDTVISSSGDNLSQGQKQLLTIARAMVMNPPMLILDEATSNIDTRTELKIQDAFETIMEGRTTFIIAHRLSTIKGADNILVMKDGNIVEQGNHEELVKRNGEYARIYNSQFPKMS